MSSTDGPLYWLPEAEAEQAVGQRQHEDDEHRGEDQELKLAGLEQEVPAEIQEKGPKHRSEYISEPAEEAVQHKINGVGRCKTRRIDGLGNGNEHRTGNPAQKGRDCV